MIDNHRAGERMCVGQVRMGGCRPGQECESGSCLLACTVLPTRPPSTIRKASLFSRLLDLASAGPSRCKHGDPSRPKEDREDLLCPIEGSERRRSDLRTGNRVEVGCPARERVGATLSFCPGHQHTPAAHNPKPGIRAFNWMCNKIDCKQKLLRLASALI